MTLRPTILLPFGSLFDVAQAPGAPEEEPAEVPAVPSKSLAVEEVRNPSRSRRSREALGGALEPMQAGDGQWR